ncbi:MAG TPA: Smr/MutS family protein, partial [Thermoanaerobaculia bacterium]|nr:Smr/MutS family protein [Thermoanaerobaculia bacterium]
TAFGREVLAVSDLLEAAVHQMAELDALEAKVEFGELSQGRLPELSEDRGWTLAAARHPLLDGRLAPLRQRVLGESRETRPVVPLDLELSPQKRMLVISGPNAGGKTVVLKTAGLFSLLAQTGLPLPTGPGTRMPVFRSVRTEVGDAQAILSDRSTFSSSMETLASILQEAGPETLALIDEIGGSTDPEEGSALAVAFLEEYLRRGGRVIVTTHLSAVKSFAAAHEDGLCAAMEFDERSGRPNYHLHPGLSGRSRALSVAREVGLPETMLERARGILGDAWRRQERREAEAEEALERLRAAEKELAAERERARHEAERLEEESARLVRERARMLEEGLAGFERARRELLHRVEEELSAMRLDNSRRAEASAERLIGQAEKAAAEPLIAEAQAEALAKTRGLVPGGHARIRGARGSGTVLSLDQETVWLEVAGKKMRLPRTELEPAGDVRTSGAVRPRTLVPERSETASAPTREVNVIGQRLPEAISEVEKSLDQALLLGAGRLRVVHGHGTGRLRAGLREHLRQHPAVASLRAADAREGGNGATIVELK